MENQKHRRGINKYMLTLSEKTYLSQVIDRYWPELKDDSYDIASAFTRPQRSKFLAHTFKQEIEIAREIIDNIKAFQTPIKE